MRAHRATRRESLLARARWSAELALQAPWQGRFPFRSPEAIRRAQTRRVRSAVAHAYRHVPYYRETMRRLDLRPDDFGDAGDLGKLPIIERSDLQRDPEYYVSRARPIDSYLRLRTGATSGRAGDRVLRPATPCQGGGARASGGAT